MPYIIKGGAPGGPPPPPPPLFFLFLVNVPLDMRGTPSRLPEEECFLAGGGPGGPPPLKMEPFPR